MTETKKRRLKEGKRKALLARAYLTLYLKHGREYDRQALIHIYPKLFGQDGLKAQVFAAVYGQKEDE